MYPSHCALLSWVLITDGIAIDFCQSSLPTVRVQVLCSVWYLPTIMSGCSLHSRDRESDSGFVLGN